MTEKLPEAGDAFIQQTLTGDVRRLAAQHVRNEVGNKRSVPVGSTEESRDL